MKYFSILRPMKNNVRFELSHGKMSDFVSIPLLGFILVIKLRNFNFKSHGNILIIFDKERYGVRFEYVTWRNVWFCFIFIIWVHFHHKISILKVIKIISYFLIEKWCQIWLCPVKPSLIWLKLCCLCKIFGNELRNTNLK